MSSKGKPVKMQIVALDEDSSVFSEDDLKVLVERVVTKRKLESQEQQRTAEGLEKKIKVEEKKDITDDTCFSLTLTTSPLAGNDSTPTLSGMSPTIAAAVYVCLRAGLDSILNHTSFDHDSRAPAYRIRQLNSRSDNIYNLQTDITRAICDSTIEERFHISVFNYRMVKELSLSDAKKICAIFAADIEDKLLLEVLCLWDSDIRQRYAQNLEDIDDDLSSIQQKHLKHLKDLQQKKEGAETEEDE